MVEVMRKNDIRNEYFDWMYSLVCGDKQYSKQVSFRKLLMHLHSTEFIFRIPMDKNRAADGVSLRFRFVSNNNCRELLEELDGPCSVLEMMLALAIRCEENIMDDPTIGDRTGQWFWGMIVNLGLGSMTDARYDKKLVTDILQRFIDGDYEPDGRGGLFTIKDCKYDLRNVEIWYQLNWYLNEYLGV